MGALEIVALLVQLTGAATKAAELFKTIHAERRDATPDEVAAVWASLDADYEASRQERDAAIKRHGG